MKKQLFSIVALLISITTFAQFTTGAVVIGTTGISIKIDTDASIATLTLTGPSDKWFGVGFGGTSMSSATDMFIWNDTPSRDYTSGGQFTPSADASQSWTIVSDSAPSSTRTIVATRPLTSSGDFTFLNSSANISIIYAFGQDGDTSLSYHGGRGTRTLTRTSLGVEDFSLNSSSVYPNPSNGTFKIESKSFLKKLTVYSQIGSLVETVELEGNSKNNEINLKNLQSGVYLLELQSDSDKAWKKIIIE
ncbi:MAG: T9SS type A sorting domain-containing protein [Flavobacterium sp.]|nr:T9SS type A sorting domain-containing protein [Flavobacterium sp.]